MKKISLVIIALAILIMLTGCGDKTVSKGKQYFEYLDTISSVYIEYEPKAISDETADQALNQVGEIMFSIEKMFSIEQTTMMTIREIGKSELMEVNENAGKSPVKVSPEFITLLDLAQQVDEQTNNNFNPAIGALTRLWDISGKVDYCGFDYDAEQCVIPSDEEVQAAMKLVDNSKITIDREEQTVFLQEEGMKLDFGGIAKGYAADLVMNYLKTYPFVAISVNLGGNLFMYGETRIKKYQGQWNAGIRNPFFDFGMDASLESVGTIHNKNVTVVTSGIYERFIEVEGKKYSHLIDSTTGYPFESNLSSVTIVCDNSALADALATGVYGMGMEAGNELLKSLGFGALFISQDKKIYVNKNLEFTPNRDLVAAGYEYITLE
jgi:thiamine biosynthesis lipoprotein